MRERPWPCPCGGGPCALEGLPREYAQKTMHYAWAELLYQVEELVRALPFPLRLLVRMIGRFYRWAGVIK